MGLFVSAIWGQGLFCLIFRGTVIVKQQPMRNCYIREEIVCECDSGPLSASGEDLEAIEGLFC